MKKYEEQATKLLAELKEYFGLISDEAIIESIRKELLIASLNGALDNLKEDK